MITDASGGEIKINDKVTILVPAQIVGMSANGGGNEELEVVMSHPSPNLVLKSGEVIKTGRGLVSLRSYPDNGFDPILGPPYPPQFYQAHAQQSAARRVYWEAPSVVIIGEASYPPGGWHVAITITNYEWPAWDVLTNYIQNQRVSHLGVSYYATSENSGFEPGSGDPWSVDDTVFSLYVKGGINEATGDPIYSDFTVVDTATAPDVQLDLAFSLEGGPSSGDLFYYYIKATSASQASAVYSQTLSFRFTTPP